MYGKSFESMYIGSMYGAGINVFAVWNYIITMTHRGLIELNPKALAATLGGTEQEVKDAIEYLSRPDPESRCKAEEGRKIVREGQFQYRVVSWEEYQRIRNAEDLREYNRRKQAEYRARLAAMTPEQRAAFEAAKVRGYRKVRRGGGIMEAKLAGEISGRTQAVSDGIADIHRLSTEGNGG